jgi:hypothetical protein
MQATIEGLRARCLALENTLAKTEVATSVESYDNGYCAGVKVGKRLAYEDVINDSACRGWFR